MNKTRIANKKIERRKARTRSKIFGTAKKPRLSVFKSSRYIYVQLIDDENRKTLASVSTRVQEKTGKKETALKKGNSAEKLGELVALKAIEKGLKEAIFDRGGYKYHGKVKLIAEGARKGGLKL